MEITINSPAGNAASGRARTRILALSAFHAELSVAPRPCSVATGIWDNATPSLGEVGSYLGQGVQGAANDMGATTNRTFPNRLGPPPDSPPV